MNESAKKLVFKVWNVAIYALFWGKFSKSWKCAGVKNLTNMISGWTHLLSGFTTGSGGLSWCSLAAPTPVNWLVGWSQTNTFRFIFCLCRYTVTLQSIRRPCHMFSVSYEQQLSDFDCKVNFFLSVFFSKYIFPKRTRLMHLKALRFYLRPTSFLVPPDPIGDVQWTLYILRGDKLRCTFSCGENWQLWVCSTFHQEFRSLTWLVRYQDALQSLLDQWKTMSSAQ